MIYIIEVESFEEFKKEFPVCKEVIIGNSTVLHVPIKAFTEVLVSKASDYMKLMKMYDILHNYQILQIQLKDECTV
jgi:hypothetical protein